MRICLSFAALAAVLTMPTPSPAQPPKELGEVHWGRELKSAQAQAREAGKPVMLLFQEVPGCSGCQRYGAEVLSHPLIVEAAEDLFVPVAIFNNRDGLDQTVREAFGEPAWNFQVVRYLTSAGKDLIPREDGVWSVGATAQRMSAALQNAGRPVPRYLESLTSETRRGEWLTGAFAMYCFWDGEAKFGGLDGVVETEAAFIDGNEVVRVTFDPRVVAWAKLVRAAEGFDCAHRVYAPNAALAKETKSRNPVTTFEPASCRRAPESDQKHALRGGIVRSLGLTPLQSARVNAAVARGDSAGVRDWLSPRQSARWTR